MSRAMKRPRKNRGMPPPTMFDIETLPGSSNFTALEAAAVIRRTTGALEQWRRDPNHPLKWRSARAARSIASMPCASIWPDAIRLRSALSRIMLAETAEQLGLDGIERIGPLQAHGLADPFRAGQLRDVVMSRFERHLADDPLFVVIVDLIDSAWLLSDAQPL